MIKTVNASPLIPALKAAGIAIAISLALILASAFFLTESSSLEALTGILPKVIQIIAVFIGGLASGRLSRGNALLTGALGGLIYGGVILIGSLISGGFDICYSLLSLSVSAVLSMLGALVGVPKEKDGKRRRRKMMKKLGN